MNILHKKTEFLSHILLLLGLTLYTLYLIYSPLYLCDDSGLTPDALLSLKEGLIHELYKYRLAEIKSESYRDLYEHLVSISQKNFRNFNQENALMTQFNEARGERRESLYKIFEIESNIRKIQPSFRSPLNVQNYLRVSRG